MATLLRARSSLLRPIEGARLGEIVIAFGMALWRWLSHYSIARCFLLFEEHKIDGCLKLLGDIDAFSLGVGNEVAAAARI